MKPNKCFSYTDGSKIFRALEIIHVKKAYLMKFYEINNRPIMLFKFYTAYNKREKIKNASQIRENRKHYRKCSKKFGFRLYLYKRSIGLCVIQIF